MEGRAKPLALIVMSEEGSDAGLVASVVEELGFEPRHHQDAGSALEAVEYDLPALVVHGWDLPDMDAVTFHGAIRQRPGGAAVATLAIVPDGESAERIAGRAGAGETLVRPLHREDLARRLERVAARMGLTRPQETKAGRQERTRSQEKEREMERSASQSRQDAIAAGLRLRVIGLGEWGVRGAELFDRQGVTARGVDAAAGVERSSLPEGRRLRIAAAGDHAAASRAMAVDASLGEALRADADAELFVVVANLGVGAGSLAATLLARIADIAPRAGRLAVARLPGARSGPEERALALVALNSVLQGPPSGIFLVQPADGVPATDADADPAAPLYRLLDLWAMASGAGPDPVQPLSASGLGRLLATPGFLGWRETTLGADDIAPDGRGWHELVTQAPWQPQGFSWSDAQAVLPMGKLPWAWLEGGGRRQFERLVQAAWDEAAPCALIPALYATDPASAVLVSAGMPYPRGVLTLRDSVEADRARLAEKRRKAETPIPLGEDFLPSGLDVLVAPMPVGPRPAPYTPPAMEAPAPRPVEAEPRWEPEAPRAPEPRREPEPVSRPAAPEPAIEAAPPVVERAPEPPMERAPEPPALEPTRLWEPEIEPVVEPVIEPTAVPEPEVEPEPWRVPEPIWASQAAEVAEPEAEAAEPRVEAAAPVEIPELELGPMPPAYESALALVRRIFSARELRAEVDLGEVRYALYDLLEILREEPHALLPEVVRPEIEEWFERHHVNVAVLAIMTGDLMKGSLSEVIDLGTAALLHDLGMLPTRDTWDVGVKLPPKVFERAIRPHADMGFRRLQEITGMTGPIARMVLEEHERMDGTGYPEGLAGEAIDPGARILAVCDTLEALTHPRPHRDHLSAGEALARLQILGQYTLDQAVVDALSGELTELFRRGARESERR
jgi:response regulator RpfG family c-di-GMP phosphodiesterase